MRRQIVSKGEAVRRRDAAIATGGAGLDRALRDTGASDTTSPDDYKDKLLKHIPAEAITVFVTLNGIINSSASGQSREVTLWVAFAVGLVGTPLYLWRLQGVTSTTQLAVSTASFAIWAFAVGSPFSLYGFYESWYASVVLVVFTFLAPAVLGTQAPTRPAP